MAHPDYFRRTKAFNKEIPMKSRARFTSMALAGLIAGALSIPLPSHAQESTAGKEMHDSGVSAKAAAGAAADSVKHAYHATKDQLGDATLTTKVKTALMTDDLTRKYTIHVESDHGKVTLDGIVDSPATAQRAQTLAANVHGVEMVRNHLTWPMSAR
jgi:hyperosmotically inducible periplasmic protein